MRRDLPERSFFCHRILFHLLLSGVAIYNPRPLAAQAPPTFNRDIYPILQEHCQTCHRPGEIGPQPFLTYAETRPWAKAIKLAVISRKMPPWFADPNYGHFKDDRRLPDADIQKIVAWVNSGAAEGEPSAIRARTWREGWNIEPDEIFQMPDPYVIPATGTLNYIYIVIPTGFVKDTWVTAAEIRPSNRSVVHHVLAVVRPPGSQWMKEAKPMTPYVPPPDAKDGEPGAGDPQSMPVDLSYELLAAYSPGMQPQRFDSDHSAKLIPAGSDIVFQIHYTPNGRNQAEDQTKIALSLAKSIPQKRFMSAVANALHWSIPPGDPNYAAHGSLTFGEPVELVFLQPHMHLRGKDMTVQLLLPNTGPGNKPETILSVPHYDFNWQIAYYLSQPRKLPAGAKIQITAHWDNSANNPANPDPTKTVVWGNQNTDEMLSLAMGVIVDR
jgi:mono/diheme cytochrome c family protein